MKNAVMLCLMILSSTMLKAQKSVLIPTSFSEKDRVMIASVLDLGESSLSMEDKDKNKMNRFKNMVVDRDSIYYDVENVATFPDGSDGLKKFISQNLVRPKNSKGETVLIRFLVERYGEISKVHVVANDLDLSPQLSAEAIKVVKKMGTWNPARIQGIEVASYYVLPIKF
jgi:hypothetical protein